MTLQALGKEWKATGPAFRSTLHGFVRSSYKTLYRQMVPEVLKTLDFRSNDEMHRPVRALRSSYGTSEPKVHNFPIEEDVALDFVPPLRRDAVVEEGVDVRPRVNRITYEIAALNALRDQVRCKEIHIAAADRYRDPTKTCLLILRLDASPTIQRENLLRHFGTPGTGLGL
jgi:hypothetical protein